MAGFPHLLKVMVPGKWQACHTPHPGQTGASGSGSEAVHKLGSSVCEPATGTQTAGPQGSPRRRSPAKASSSCPQSQPLPAMYGACKVGKLGKSSAHAKGEGWVGGCENSKQTVACRDLEVRT